MSLLPIPTDYYDKLGRAESSNNPLAKAKGSSASGLFQFVQSTWTSLGYAWKDVFNPDKQNEAIQKLTTQNATYLQSKGVSIDDVSLYAAHFLGAGSAAKLYNADPNADASTVLPAGYFTANPQLKGLTVQGVKDWLAGRIGGDAVTNALASGRSLPRGRRT